MYYTTTIPNIIVDISIRTRKDGSIVGKGIPKNRQTEEYIEEIGVFESTAGSAKREAQLIRRIIEEIELRHQQIQPEKEPDSKALKAAFAIVEQKVETGMRLKTGWNSLETNQNAIKFFKRNVLELLLPFANPAERQFLVTDRETIEEAIKKGCLNRNRGKVGGEVEAAYTHLQNADLIYQSMRAVDPRLPEITLSSDSVLRRIPPEEQAKALSRSTMRKFCDKLKSMISKNPKLVFFAVLMIFGLRPAEGAAIKPCAIVFMETYCFLHVVVQGKKRSIEKSTKNSDSIRIVVIPYWGTQMLRECCHCIEENYPHDNATMNDSVQCSFAIKELLIESGASEEFFSETVLKELSTMDMDPEDREDSQVAKKKIACYVLRRNFASICRNVMGLTLSETDALMGHVVQGSNGGRERSYRRPDLSIPDVQKKIAAKMERYVFDPEVSLHPAQTAVELRADDREELMEYSEYVFAARDGCPLEVSFNLEAVECGEEVTVILETGSEQQKKLTVNSYSSMKKSWEDRERKVIGDCDRYGTIEWEKR